MGKNQFLITIVILLICFTAGSILLVTANNQFSESIHELAEEMPLNIVASQETYIRKNDALLKSIAMKITEMREDNYSFDANDLTKLFNEYGNILEVDNIKMYAVIDNEIYSTDDVKYVDDYKKTEWYEQVMKAPEGEIIYTNARLYNGTEENVVTSAIKIAGSNDVLAINLFPERITTWPDIEDFPSGTCYYISDKNGKIIHQDNSNPDVAPDETQKYIDSIYEDLGIEKEANSNLTVGTQAGIYTAETYNGWEIVVIVPYEHMLAGIRNVLVIYYATVVLFLILSIYLIISERNAAKGKYLYNRITRTLGDIYYALYLVDFEQEEYTILKGSEYIKKSIPKKGNYDAFMDCMETIMDKETFKEFKETFSIQNIRKFVESNVTSMGGDFKRIVGNGFKWVNVQMLYSEENVKRKKPEVIFAFQDVDKRKQKELEEKEVLHESIETMQLATQTKNRFFANMSHDMRTPLNAIINLSNLAQAQIDNREKLLDYIKKINISSTQLLELINNILEISKIEENMPLINKVEFNITSALKDAISVFEEQARLQKKKFEVEYNIKHDYVLCDWGKIRQIINNVLSNALKYTRNNGHVFVEINETEGKFVSKYEFRVVDDGIGMSKEFLDKIYTPFERETRFHSEEMSGTGLGMSIVQSNVQKLNGQIEIKSEPGKGSEVRVILPLEIGEGAKEGTEVESKDMNELKGMKILLVEDNELNMEISTEILEMKGVKITPAIDGKQAVDIFINSKEGYFDAILMDIQMPIMDGYEATKAIRRLSRKDAKNIIILAVTANTFAEDIIAAEKAGMNDHIAKPIDFAELQKTLTKYMKG